ncbi:hypothetical protein GOBAR_AA34097 [Gossypium barbadense]|uniref:Uncharacterized protein n=1 Tax=Gossypium barbadense TaxID=3634 RepID=A0A2P5W684_GOSBA|nr:hypothetical protein GOBAR_AA34097 [Gossypium barbadense]
MDGGGSGGDGVSDSENEPIEGSTSTTVTQNPSVVIGQEHQPEPSRFPLHNYSPPPPPSWPPPPSSPPPVRRTPSYPPPRPPPRTSLRSYTPPPPPRRPLTVTNFSFSRPTDPLRARIPPPPGFSFPTPRPRPLRQPSPALAARPFLTYPGRRNRLKIITKRKRSEESKDGNNEERSGIVIRDKQPPSRDRCKEDQQGNPDDPDSDKDDSLPRMDIYQGIVD